MTSQFTEQSIELESTVSVDQESRTVSNVAFAGPKSLNGYEYTTDSFVEAINSGKYDGRPVFLDHDREQPSGRSVRDLIGTTKNARLDAGRVRGDIEVLDTESGRTFLALTETKSNVGMSHVVSAKRSEDGTRIDHIERVVSVDAVVFPATTTSLSEQTLEKDEPMADAVTKDDLKALGESFDEKLDSLLELIGEQAEKPAPKVEESVESVDAKTVLEQDAERRKTIRGLFMEANFGDKAEEFCDNTKNTVEDARKWLLDALIKRNTEPTAEGSGDAGNTDDPKDKFREEYRQNAAHLTQMGVTEEQYVASAMKG